MSERASDQIWGGGKRLALDWLPFALTFALARDRRVGAWEQVGMRRVNGLPERLHYPLWVVMQAGTAGAPVVAGGLALATGRPALARRLTTSGLAAYVLAKWVKRLIRRGRPGELVTGVLIRGRPASGHGYVSGHAAVSMALGSEAVALLRKASRPLPVVGAAVVAVGRVYVGAHLPLDAVGGAALGWAISRTAHEVEHRFGGCRV